MYRLSALILLGVLIFPDITIGMEGRSIATDAGHLSSGGNFTINTFSLFCDFSNADSPFIFNVGTLLSKGKIEENKYSFQHFNLSESYKSENLEISAFGGFVNRSEKLSKDLQKFEGAINLKTNIADTGIMIEGGYHSIAEDMQSKRAIQDLLRGAYYSVQLRQMFTEKIKATIQTRSIFLNDKNKRSNSDFSLMYGISPSWPWIWVGGGAEYLKNKKMTPAYWSPSKFYSYGPRFDIAFPIKDKFSFATGVNLNRFHDANFGSGKGYYLNAKLIYGESSSTHTYLGFESIKSQQGGNSWNSKSIQLGLKWLL